MSEGVLKDNLSQIVDILERAKSAAIDYYRLTRKPLGITGEIGEYIAAKHLRSHPPPVPWTDLQPPAQAADPVGRVPQNTAKPWFLYAQSTGASPASRINRKWVV